MEKTRNKKSVCVFLLFFEKSIKQSTTLYNTETTLNGLIPGATKRECTCAQFDDDLANLAKLYAIFHTRFSTHDFPHTIFLDAIFDF